MVPTLAPVSLSRGFFLCTAAMGKRWMTHQFFAAALLDYIESISAVRGNNRSSMWRGEKR